MIALVIVISLSDMGLLLPLGRLGVGGIADASRRLPGWKVGFTESRTVSNMFIFYTRGGLQAISSGRD